jgi:hypothetical protein
MRGFMSAAIIICFGVCFAIRSRRILIRRIILVTGLNEIFSFCLDYWILVLVWLILGCYQAIGHS